MKKPRTDRTRRLLFETLEAREVMAAGITASLNASGVLNVVGTDNADQIKFQQTNGNISIVGLAGSWSAANVKSIVVDMKGGNDLVSLESIVNGGKQAIAEQVTIKSGAGTERVRLANGKDVNFAGAGFTVQVATDGSASLNGAALNFSNSILVSFQSGVLTVTGTNANDNIQFLQSGGKISIKGVAGSWTAKDVKSIVVRLQDGNDNVSLDSIANGGQQALAVAFTINSGNGTDKVHIANGKDVTFTGLGHVLTVAVNGSAVLDGKTLSWNAPAPPTPPTNWFDTHVTDAALRTLGHNLYVDGLIDRNDIIALFRSAEDGSVIDATELNDLRSIASTTTLFGTLDAVRTLTTYITTGSVANRNYQGQALGGLNAGSSAAQMEKFINKWFLGLDRPTATGTYRQFAGTLFVNSATYADIHQGAVGDCYFVSSLAEVAFRNASTIVNMFTVNGDGTYTVKFFNYGVATYVTVDSYLPTDSAGRLIYASRGSMYNNAGNELWVALAEKAYAQVNEFGFTRAGFADNGQNAYSAINGGYIYAALGHITGQSTTAFAMTSAPTSFNAFVSAFNQGKMIGFASFQTPQQGSGVVGGHAYAVVGYNATTQTITLFNPWGTEYGLVTLTSAQIQANFQYFDRVA